MKNLIRFIFVTLFLFFLFFLARYMFFQHPDVSKLDVHEQQTISHQVFILQKEALTGYCIRLKGYVVDSYFGLGIGYYTLESADGERIDVWCDHFPPAENQFYDVLVYVKPLFKLEEVITAQIEVEPISEQLAAEPSLSFLD